MHKLMQQLMISFALLHECLSLLLENFSPLEWDLELM